MNIPLYEHLLIKKDTNGKILVNEQRLKEIRKKFNDINGDQDRENDILRGKSIKTLINQLNLIEDKFCLKCLHKCCSAGTDGMAERAIKIVVQNDIDILSKIQIDQTEAEIKTTVTSNISTNQQNEDLLEKIICIIQQKSIKNEVNDFLKQFLFHQINQNSL